MKVKRFCQPLLVKKVDLRLTSDQYIYLEDLARCYNIKITQMIRIILQDVMEHDELKEV